MKKSKTIIIFLLGIVFLWALFLGYKKMKQQSIIEQTLESSHWKQRSEIISTANKEKYKVIFLGNSLTEMFDVNYYFQDSSLLNAGITGDFTEGLVKRCDAIIQLKPEKLFIEIGINDIIEKVSLKEICTNYETLIKKIRQESPNTKIYIQSNLPVIIRHPSLLTSNADVNNLVIEQNKNLQQISKKYNCIYVDIYNELMQEKNKESLFIPDGIHLTPYAYSIWTSVVKPYLDKSS